VKSNPLVNSHNSRLGCPSIVDHLDVIEKVETGSIAENIGYYHKVPHDTKNPQSHTGCIQ